MPKQKMYYTESPRRRLNTNTQTIKLINLAIYTIMKGYVFDRPASFLQKHHNYIFKPTLLSQTHYNYILTEPTLLLTKT